MTRAEAVKKLEKMRVTYRTRLKTSSPYGSCSHESLRDSLEALGLALAALDPEHEHNWQYKGHGHNDALYECSTCGKEELR
jgi:hypothetical protein